MIRRLLVGLLVLLLLAVLGVYALAWRKQLDPIAPPAAASFPAERIAHGEVLAGAGYCATCHTVRGGADYAGGHPLVTDFGTIYSTNITPDPDTGIGQWSEAAFIRAMRTGVARDGSHLFPAFPYNHFAKASDEDLRALYAYFMTRKPVLAPAKKNDLPFPLNWRALQAGWKLLFFHDDQPFTPIAGKSAAWNRGAYLAEGLSHCGACHTPRNKLGAEKGGDARYAGAVIEDWFAPALTAANSAPLPWTEAELFGYLRHGATALHGSAAGAMSPVVHQGLAKLPDSDIQALAVYFADLNGSAGKPALAADARLASLLAASAGDTRPQRDADGDLYLAACVSCHYNRGPMPLLERPELGLNSALGADDPATLIQIILNGIGVDEGIPGVMMPGFGHALGDADVARLAAYLRRTRTERPPWPDLERRVAQIRGQQHASAGAR